MPKRSKSAHLAALVAVLALFLVVVGLLGARLRWLEPFMAFRLFAAGLVLGGLLSLVLGFVGMLRTGKKSSKSGRGRARFAVFVGAFLLTTLAFRLASVESTAPIHDITTDPADPPAFDTLAAQPANEGRDLSYPHGLADTAERQRQEHPDLRPLELTVPADQAFERARRAAQEAGWNIVWANAELGLIEATAESGLFRFVDDVVVRVRPTDTGSVIDLRSTSRVGMSDLGANAARIRDFAARLDAG